jgi:hypothetical protein
MEEILKNAREEMVAKFVAQLYSYGTLKKQHYVVFFLKHHIRDDIKFCSSKSYLHKRVNSTNFSREDESFYHSLIECDVPADQFINELHNIYGQIDGISDSYNGEIIQTCLNESKKFKIVEEYADTDTNPENSDDVSLVDTSSGSDDDYSENESLDESENESSGGSESDKNVKKLRGQLVGLLLDISQDNNMDPKEKFEMITKLDQLISNL